MHILWYQDTGDGGSELSSKILRDNAPRGVILEYTEKFYIPSVSPDLIYLGNSTRLTLEQVKTWDKIAPIVKCWADIGSYTSHSVFSYLQRYARNIFRAVSQYNYMAKTHVLDPYPYFCAGSVDVTGVVKTQKKYDLLYVGVPTKFKGFNEVRKYSELSGRNITLIGKGTEYYRGGLGRLSYNDTLQAIQQANTLVHLPVGFDACPRVLMESYLLGTEIITNSNQGATEWFSSLDIGVNFINLFWKHIGDITGNGIH